MDNNGIARRPALDLINAGDSGGVPGIGGEAVNGFGGQRDQLPGAEQFGGPLDGLREERSVVSWQDD